MFVLSVNYELWSVKFGFRPFSQKFNKNVRTLMSQRNVGASQNGIIYGVGFGWVVTFHIFLENVCSFIWMQANIKIKGSRLSVLKLGKDWDRIYLFIIMTCSYHKFQDENLFSWDIKWMCFCFHYLVQKSKVLTFIQNDAEWCLMHSAYIEHFLWNITNNNFISHQERKVVWKSIYIFFLEKQEKSLFYYKSKHSKLLTKPKKNCNGKHFIIIRIFLF